MTDMTDMTDNKLINIVNTLEEIEKDYEMAKGFWDSTGLALYIAVKRNNSIGFSTKHWADCVYLETQNSNPMELWHIVGKVADEIGRTLVRAERGSFVYIPNLDEKQTEQVYQKIVSVIQSQNILFDEVLKMEWEWEIDDAVLFKNPAPSEIIDKQSQESQESQESQSLFTQVHETKDATTTMTHFMVNPHTTTEMVESFADNVVKSIEEEAKKNPEAYYLPKDLDTSKLKPL